MRLRLDGQADARTGVRPAPRGRARPGHGVEVDGGDTAGLHPIETAARRRRHERLMALLATQRKPLSVLDVGGTTRYWHTVGVDPGVFERIVLLNLFEQPAQWPFVPVVGDARDLSRYADHAFDLVFSNSVIGHVGTLADQHLMAREVRRVGRHYFVQTPNQGFPVDWRTLVPFFHFLPPAVQAWCFQHLPVGSYRRVRDRAEAVHLATRVRNLRRADIASLFPGASVEIERSFGLAKSFMIHNLPER